MNSVQRCELESLDQGAAFANGITEFNQAESRIFLHDLFNDTPGVVAATVEDHDKLKLSGVILLKVMPVLAQHRFDATLLVVGWNQQQQAGFGHARNNEQCRTEKQSVDRERPSRMPETAGHAGRLPTPTPWRPGVESTPRES